MSTDTRKELPNNIDAEQALLGILLNDVEALSSVSRYPLPADFFLERHRIIASTIFDLADNGKLVDIITVAEALRAGKNLEKVGEAVYLSELTDKGFASQNVDHYIDIIIEKSQRRKIIQYAHSMLGVSQDESMDIASIIERSEKDILSITDRVQGEQYHVIKDLLGSFIKSIDNRLKNTAPGEFLGIPSGYPSLDSMLTGFHEGEFIVLAARPSIGKTAFALNLIHHIAIENETPTAFFSLEMSGYEIISRLVSIRTGIQGNQIRQNMLQTREISRIIQSFSAKFNAPLFISDVPSMNLFDIRMQARRLVAKEGIKVLFVDYLGLIGYQDGAGNSSRASSFMARHEKFSEISRALKGLARELHIPIVALSQLNRDSEDREPTLANIRESGAIEQDADVVMMLHRKRTEDDTRLIVAKQRNGPIGDVNLTFSRTNMSFSERAASDNN